MSHYQALLVQRTGPFSLAGVWGAPLSTGSAMRVPILFPMWIGQARTFRSPFVMTHYEPSSQSSLDLRTQILACQCARSATPHPHAVCWPQSMFPMWDCLPGLWALQYSYHVTLRHLCTACQIEHDGCATGDQWFCFEVKMTYFWDALILK